MYSYYEFLYILYEHIEIEEINIDVNGVITLKNSNKLYHVISKPTTVSDQDIPLPINNNVIENINTLVSALKGKLFIIIKKIGQTSQFLPEICMYNLFTGTIHVFEIVVDDKPTEYFLLSLFTEYELMPHICKDASIKLYECRLYKQGDKIKFKLNKKMVDIMFGIYESLRHTGHYANRLFRGNPEIDDKFLNQLDDKLLKVCSQCISVRDIAFNTTLWLLPNKIGAKDHPDILNMEKDFLKNKFELINSNEKLYLWKYKYENLIQLWEYSLKDLEVEVLKFKKELLELEPHHQELLVQKLNEKGFNGCTMKQILENSALCYLKTEDQPKKLVYENIKQKDPKNNKFVKKCKFIPEMKELLETNLNPESELHKYRQTILFLRKDTDNEKKYMSNQSYFFMDSFYLSSNTTFDKIFDPLAWSAKLNKLCFQCLAIRDWLIFPLRIINIEYLQSPLNFEFNIQKQECIGYFHTIFIDNYDSIEKFDEQCRDKFYFIYRYTDPIGNVSGKEYRLHYYTGNNIWFEASMLPYYKICVCEINWIYYTFILKYKTIPYFYEFINEFCEKEIVVSKFSLDQIRCIYKEKRYSELELDILNKVHYNHNYYKRTDNDKIFVDESLFSSKEEEQIFVNKVLLKK